MTTFVLIRHAASVGLGQALAGRSPGVPLTPAGRAQAEALAAELGDLAFDHIFSSPLQRCRETAQALFGHGIATEPDLNEIDFGRWTQRTFVELAHDAAWQDWNARRSVARAPGGESMREVQARLVQRLEKWAAEMEGQTVAAISHADTIKAVVAHCRGESLDDLQSFEIAPASVTIVNWQVPRPAVLLVNGTGREAADRLRLSLS